MPSLGPPLRPFERAQTATGRRRKRKGAKGELPATQRKGLSTNPSSPPHDGLVADCRKEKISCAPRVPDDLHDGVNQGPEGVEHCVQVLACYTELLVRIRAACQEVLLGASARGGPAPLGAALFDAAVDQMADPPCAEDRDLLRAIGFPAGIPPPELAGWAARARLAARDLV